MRRPAKQASSTINSTLQAVQLLLHNCKKVNPYLCTRRYEAAGKHKTSMFLLGSVQAVKQLVCFRGAAVFTKQQSSSAAQKCSLHIQILVRMNMHLWPYPPRAHACHEAARRHQHVQTEGARESAAAQSDCYTQAEGDTVIVFLVLVNHNEGNVTDEASETTSPPGAF